jgi:cytochrome c peroxidase
VSWGGADLGRYAVTKQDPDRGKYKTPTLRGVKLTPPYMHDGSLKTLEEVVEFYNKGGGANPHLDPAMRPLNLSKGELADLVAFLKAL